MSEARRRGRPALEPEDRRKARSVAFSEKEWEAIAEQAADEGSRTSVFIRRRALTSGLPAKLTDTGRTGGRWNAPPGMRRWRRNIAFSDEEWRRVKAAADLAQMSVSDFVRAKALAS